MKYFLMGMTALMLAGCAGMEKPPLSVTAPHNTSLDYQSPQDREEFIRSVRAGG